MIRVLFLDIDGVLNSREFFSRTLEARRAPITPEEQALMTEVHPHQSQGSGVMPLRDFRQIDAEAVALLNQVTDQPDVRVVISSSIRLGLHWQGIEVLLKARGFQGQVIGQTPELYAVVDAIRYREVAAQHAIRGTEIQMWLDRHQQEAGFGYMGHTFPDAVQSVAIVDDDADMGPWLPRLVKTDNVHGLTQDDVTRLQELLSEPIG